MFFLEDIMKTTGIRKKQQQFNIEKKKKKI